MSTHITTGKFLGLDTYEVVISRGKMLKILTVDQTSGETFNLSEQQMKHQISSLGTTIGESKGENHRIHCN